MKKIISVLFFALTGTLFAQSPQQFNYQGVVRDAVGVPITTLTSIGVQFAISDASNNIVHQETQGNIPVNSLGLFNTRIGLSPTISNTVTWQNGPYTLSVSVDIGSGFSFLGSQQLLSVPFALYAKNSGNSSASTSLTVNSPHSTSGSGTSSLSLSIANPTLTATGVAASTFSVGYNLNVDVPAPVLGYTAGVNVLSLTQGTSTSTVNLNGVGSSTINLTGTGNASVNPNFGSSFTINVPPQVLTSNNNTITLSNGGGSVAVPMTNVTGSTGISVTGNSLTGFVITNTANATGWSTTGNAGTNPATNFIGTNDPTDFIVKTANTQRILVKSGGNIGINNGSPLSRVSITETFSNQAGMDITMSNPAGTYDGLFVQHNGVGAGIRTQITNAANNAPALQALSNGSNTNSHAIFAEANSPNSAGIYATNVGTGFNFLATKSGTQTGTLGKFTNSSAGNSLPVISIVNQSTVGSDGINVLHTGGVGIPIFVQNNGHGHGVYATTNSSVASNAALYGINSNQGSGVYGASGTFNSSSAGVYGMNNGGGYAVLAAAFGGASSNAHGVRALANSTSPLAAAVKAENDGAGPSVYGIKNNVVTTGNAGLFEIINAANASESIRSISTLGNAVHGINSSSTSAAIFAENSSSYHALQAFNSGTGVSLFANKTGGATGNAAYFENLTSNNAQNIVLITNASTVTTSAALAVYAGVNPNNSPNAVEIKDGHIKSSVSINTPTITAPLCSWTGTGNIVISGAKTDVKGKILVNFPSSTISPGQSIDVKVSFVKPYNGSQSIVVTPVFINFNSYIVNVNTADFTVRFVNNTATAFGGITNFEFSYFVIE